MNNEAIERIRSALHGDDPKLRADAIRFAVANTANTTDLLADLYVLCSSSLRPVASDAWQAIRRYKSLAVPFLLDLLNSDSALDRENAVELLLLLGYNRSSWRINEQILADRPSSQPDWHSYRDDVLSRLNSALHDSNNDVRLTAAIALDEIGQPPPNLVQQLADGLRSRNVSLQNLAALHLGRLGSSASSGMPALREFVASNIDPTDGTFRPVLAALNAIDRINRT